MFKHQEDATLSQDNPVSGTEYALTGFSNPQSNVRIIGASAAVTWTGQPTPLQIHIDIDGNRHTWNFTDPVSETPYQARRMNLSLASDSYTLEALTEAAHAFLAEGRSVSVTVETTGGTVQNLSARLHWAKVL